jgi:hypothetical protein
LRPPSDIAAFVTNRFTIRDESGCVKALINWLLGQQRKVCVSVRRLSSGLREMKSSAIMFR